MTNEERESCIKTIELLRRLAFNVHGVMDVIDAENCDKIIKMLGTSGHWIIDIDESRRWDRRRFYCSECGDWQTYGETKFCPECGCAMERSKQNE
jgi:rRNA maturation endonuclease Nob1